MCWEAEERVRGFDVVGCAGSWAQRFSLVYGDVMLLTCTTPVLALPVESWLTALKRVRNQRTLSASLELTSSVVVRDNYTLKLQLRGYFSHVNESTKQYCLLHYKYIWFFSASFLHGKAEDFECLCKLITGLSKCLLFQISWHQGTGGILFHFVSSPNVSTARSGIHTWMKLHLSLCSVCLDSVFSSSL